MGNTSGSVHYLYSTAPGRFLLKWIMKTRMDRIAVWFLRSPLSKPLIGSFVKKNGLDVTKEEIKSFHTYQQMFTRTRPDIPVDPAPEHLISPCDSWLSAFPIDQNSCFSIKGSHYRIQDFLQDDSLAQTFLGGTCLVFRLCVTDYHHYCYIDDGYQEENHPIPGALHSVQPIACEQFPIYVLNKRSWCLMRTDHFGPVVQCEIGALVVGGIVNPIENARFSKGQEKGYFDLAGSTVVLLFAPGQIQLLPELQDALSSTEEVQVKQGQWIGNKFSAVD